MTNFRITSNSGARVERTTTLFERARGGLGRSWTVTSQHDRAVVWCDGNSWSVSGETIVCDPRDGYGLGETLHADFTFDDAFTDTDKNHLISGWSDCAGYGIDLEKWAVEEDYIKISGSAEIKLVDRAGNDIYQAA